MKVTRTLLVTMLLLGGCGGCERSEPVPHTDSAVKPAATAGPAKAAAPETSPEEIQAGTVQPTVERTEPTVAAAATTGQAPPAAPPVDTMPELAGDEEDDCIVVADANPDYGPPPLTVTFASEAECSGGTPKFDWDFGDGSPHTSEPNPSHTYTKPGEYTATVTVTGRGEATADDEIDITVEEAEGADAE